MSTKIGKACRVLGFCIAVFCWAGSLAASAETAPVLNQGHPWRIAYYEGGEYSEYVDTMRTLVQGLMNLGWIGPRPLPAVKGDAALPFWTWLAGIQHPYLEFRAENGYSAGWNPETRSLLRRELMAKLKSGRVDLVIAMGTWAGQDLANCLHSVPVLVLSTSDPIRAGIVQSAQDSGYDHVTARIDPNRYLRQIRMFHRIVRFDRLGVAFEDTQDGRIYSVIADLEQVSQERGFRLVTCKVQDTIEDTDKADRSCMDCYSELARNADAVYVTALTCADRILPQMAGLFIRHRIPSFALVGSKYVRQGLMMSISSDSGYQALGAYNAGKFAAILNGASPRSLPQVFEDPLHIAVNKDTARKIGFALPTSIIHIAREVYGE